MSKSDFSAVTELVPQVSYDVIGRIIPGIIATLSLAIAVLGPTQAFAEIDVRVIHPDPPLSGWVVVLFIVVAYTLAVVLDGIWHIPDLFRRPRYEGYKSDLENPSVPLQYDMVRIKSPEAGARLVKLGAESHQARVLITGWLISAAINLYFLVAAFSLERLWLEVTLIVGIVGAFSSRKHISENQRLGLIDHWFILQCDRLPSSTEGHSDHEAQR
jgi:hypothetical protein